MDRAQGHAFGNGAHFANAYLEEQPTSLEDRAGGRPKRKKLLGDVPTFENLSEHRNQFIGLKRLRKTGDVRKDSGKTRAVITGHKDKGPASLAKGLGY